MISLPAFPLWFEIALPAIVVAGVAVIALVARKPKVPRSKVPKTKRPTMNPVPSPKEVKVGSMIPIRYTQQKRQADGSLTRITTSSTGFMRPKVKLGVRFLVVKTGLQALPYRMHFIELKHLDENGELTFDEDYSEAIDPMTGEPAYSDELEDILTQGLHQQMVEVATQFWRFVFQRQHIAFMALGVAAFLFAALGLETVFNPHTGIQIDWTYHPIGGITP